jgi:hypothetical protein
MGNKETAYISEVSLAFDHNVTYHSVKNDADGDKKKVETNDGDK